MSQLAYLRINSQDRKDHNGVKSNFTVDLKESYNTQAVRSLQIGRVSVPNVFYNISDTLANRTIEIKQDGEASTDVTIPAGQYTITTFIAAWKAAIDAVLTGGTIVTITQDADTQLLLFTFSGGTNPTVALNSPAVDTVEAWYSLGFYNSRSVSGAWTATYIPNIRGYSDVYVHCKAINGGDYYDGDSGAISAFAQVSFADVPFDAVGHYQTSNHTFDTIRYSTPRNISSLKIVLRDSQGNVLDTGGSDINIVLRINHE